MSVNLKNTGGFVLAAGFSRRMGAYKPMLDVGGKPAVACALDAMNEAGIGATVVVTGFNREVLVPVINAHGAVEAFNPDFDDEMFLSMKRGVSAILEQNPNCEGIFMTPVDCPAILSADYKLLYEKVHDLDKCACVSFLGRKGHPLWFPRRVFDKIINFTGNGGMKGALAGEEILRIDSENEGVLLDMDTPEGYEKIKAFVANGYKFPMPQELFKGQRLILARHGRIVQHKEKIFLGQYDAPLSELGRQDACIAAEKLSSMELNLKQIFTSPLSRAYDTAQICAEKLGVGVEPVPELMEIDLGLWDGKFISEIKENYPDEFARRGADPMNFIPPKGESMIHLRIRVLDALRKIAEQCPDGDIVAVTHVGVINTALCLMGRGEFENVFTMKKPNYGEVTVVE